MTDRIGRAIDDVLGPRLIAGLFAVMFALSGWGLSELHVLGVSSASLAQQVDDRARRGDERYAELRQSLASIGGKLDVLATIGASIAVLGQRLDEVARRQDEAEHRLDTMRTAAPPARGAR